VRLAEIADIELDEARRDTLADMNGFNMEGRYPDTMKPAPDRQDANDYCRKAGEVRRMADENVEDVVRLYLRAVSESGIPVEFGVLFGSWATGRAGELSDIDVVVVSPRFDGSHDHTEVNRLWRLAARTDSRIEPVACGVHQWKVDDSTPIIEVARREGRTIEA
jgi:predicted nucleotidyltransferase